MGLLDLLGQKSATRRTVLKAMAAVGAVAVTAGCDKSEDEFPNVMTPQDDLIFDTEAKLFHSSSSWNCGSKCVHNLLVKNGRVLKITSMGDIPREGSQESDENVGGPGNPVQRRGCVRCYGYVQRNYQPDRLRYPLLQTREQGDINGFKRISWDEAAKIVAENYIKTVGEAERLGYIPFLKNGGAATSYITNSLYRTIQYNIGNHSTGTHDAAKFETVGVDAYCNSNTDILNSKFLLLWAIDPTRTTYWNENQHWYITKAKEKGIPIVVITTNFNDSSASLATGVEMTDETSGKTYTVPKWVPCRPATDGALAVAMAYVMYKNDWHDTDYLGVEGSDYNIKRRCFGFYPNDVVVSNTPGSNVEAEDEYVVRGGVKMKKDGRFRKFAAQKWYIDVKTPKAFVDADGRQFNVRDTFNGAKFKVTEGESFVEYLLSLEVEWGGATGVEKDVTVQGVTRPIKYKQPATKADVDDTTYKKVLAYVTRITGVPAEIITSLAYVYSHIKPSCLFAGGGPQRSWNGQEWCNMMMGLSAMTGNISRSGGGTGYTMSCMADKLAYKSCVTPGGALSFNGNIMVTVNDWAHTILTGKDYRSRKRFIADTKMVTKEKGTKWDGEGAVNTVDLSGVAADKPLLEVKFLQFRPRNSMITSGNTNKCIAAVKHVGENGGFVMVQDQCMTPTATHANIVLPAASVWERYAFYSSMYQGGNFLINKLVDPIGDAKGDEEIDNLITKKISEITGEELSLKDEATETGRRESYETGSRNNPSDEYLAAYPGTEKPTWEKLKEVIVNEFPVGPERPFIGLRDPYADYTAANPLGYGHDIGSLENSTGYINFWSPLWGYIDPYDLSQFDVSKLTAAGVSDKEKRMYGDGVRNATMCYEPNPLGYDKFFDANGKFEGIESTITGRGKYTLLYMTNKPRHRSHTMFDNVAIVKDQFPQTAKMNPADALTRGIKDGDMVYVYNDRGCIYIPAEVDHHMIPGVISVEHGAWYRAHPTEKVTVKLNTDGVGDVAKEKEYQMPVDVGGNENTLTDDYGTVSMQIGMAVSAQGGPCEVSLKKPN